MELGVGIYRIVYYLVSKVSYDKNVDLSLSR